MNEAQPEEKLLVSIQEHLQGFKDLSVRTRAGTDECLRLHAPSRKALREFMVSKKDAGPEDLIGLCLPEFQAESRLQGTAADTLLDKLTTGSANEVEICAHILAYGADFEKKILRGLPPNPIPPPSSAPR